MEIMEGEITELSNDFKLDFVNGQIKSLDISHIILEFDDCNILIPVVDNYAVKPFIKIKKSKILNSITVWGKENLILTVTYNRNSNFDERILFDQPIIKVTV